MKKQNLQNQEINRIGDRVLRAVRLPDEQINMIVGSPHLFASIQSAIESELTVKKAVKPPMGWPVFSVFNWKTGLAAATITFFVITGTIGFLRPYSPRQQVVANVVQPNSPDTIAPLRLINDVEALPLSPVHASADRNGLENKQHAAARSIQRKVARLEKEVEMGEFQALGYTGDANDNEGRIVRVELPRSSLFAMGVDIPVENETAKIKTDLLIGPDGVMKAVRVARN